MHRYFRSSTSLSSLFALTVVAGCSGGDKASDANAVRTDSGAAAVATCAAGTAGLTLPAGFCATIFADSIGASRDVAVASNGDVYTTIERKAPDPTARRPA